jgi:hypothetical protein
MSSIMRDLRSDRHLVKDSATSNFLDCDKVRRKDGKARCLVSISRSENQVHQNVSDHLLHFTHAHTAHPSCLWKASNKAFCAGIISRWHLPGAQKLVKC